MTKGDVTLTTVSVTFALSLLWGLIMCVLVERYCVICGESFKGRRHAYTDSESCRQKLSRLLRKCKEVKGKIEKIQARKDAGGKNPRIPRKAR